MGQSRIFQIILGAYALIVLPGCTKGFRAAQDVSLIQSSSTPSPSPTPSPAPSPGVGHPAQAVETFLESLGANIHDDQINNDSGYASQFVYTGIRNARAGAVRSAEQIPLSQATAVAGVSPGIKFSIGFYGGSDISAIISDAQNLAKVGLLLDFEGPNEPNNQPFTYNGVFGGGTSSWLPVAMYQRDLYAAVKADPVVGTTGANIPVFDTTEVGAEQDNVGLQFLTIPADSGITLMPIGTQYADYANVHNYTPATVANNTWNSSSLNQPGPGGSDGMYGEYIGVTWGKQYPASSTSAVLPTVTTEFGGSTSSQDTSSPLTQSQQGILILNQFLADFTRGQKYSFVYQMRDNEGGNAGFGLFDSSGNPKSSGTYIHNLTTILQDMTVGTLGSLNYNIPSEPQTTHDLLLQRSDGTFFLIVWDEVYDGTNNTVQFNLGSSFATVQVFDPTSGTAAVQALSNSSSVTIQMSGHPWIIEIP